MAKDRNLGPCPICGRPMVDGPSVDRHHWIPKREGGRCWAWIHRVCHKKLHSLFNEKTLARDFPDAESLREHPDIENFVKWVRKQPPEFIGRHASPKARA